PARLNEELGLRSAGAPLKYPPLFYVAMRPWTWLPFRAAALAWLALGQVLLVVTAALVLRRRAAEPARLVAVLAVAALSQPLVETLHLGPANVVVLALLALGWRGSRPRCPRRAPLHLLLAGGLGARAVEPVALATSLAILAAVAYAARGRPAPGTPAFDWAFGLAVAAVPLVAPFSEEHHLVVLLL